MQILHHFLPKSIQGIAIKTVFFEVDVSQSLSSIFVWLKISWTLFCFLLQTFNFPLHSWYASKAMVLDLCSDKVNFEQVISLFDRTSSKLKLKSRYLAPPPIEKLFWRGKNICKSKLLGFVTDLLLQIWLILRLWIGQFWRY